MNRKASVKLNKLVCSLLALTLTLTSVSAVAGETIRYVHTDHLGTPIAWTDENGNVVKTSEYEPYGLVLNRAPDDSPGYTGHVEDAATGLTYMQQRYYDPGIGMFLSVDPVTAHSNPVGQFNRYRYANGNPYLYTDPTGESTCANANCSMSYVDSRVGQIGAPPIDSSLAGSDVYVAPVHISFKNDDPNGASPNKPLTTETANMIEEAAVASGASSININSTSGGEHSTKSRHYQKKAVDINSVNDKGVDDPSNATAVRDVQEAFSNQSNIRENFGPSRNEKTNEPGGTASPRPDQARAHEDHIHVSGQY